MGPSRPRLGRRARSGQGRRLSRALFAAAGLGLGLFEARAADAEIPAAPDAPRREFRVDFSARHLEVDSDLGELELWGDVVVGVGRYRLVGSRVRLQRGPRGIRVEGGGGIAFCQCERPPIRLTYRAVTIAPPSDVIIEGAVLRAFGVPVFWSPYLWLRSPDRVSLAFPSAEWRGEDGLLVGSALHLPFDSNQGRPPASVLDLGLAGYTEGGFRADAKLLTAQSTSLVRYDRRGGSALRLDAHGSTRSEGGAVLAFAFDAARGARGRRAESELDSAARSYDRARVGVGSSGGWLFGAGIGADAERGGALDDFGALGPFVSVGFGRELGPGTRYQVDWAAETRHGAPSLTRSLERASLSSSAPAGPLLVTFAGFQQADALVRASSSRSTVRVGAGSLLSLPLLRRFPGVTHVVEPVLAGRIEQLFIEGDDSTRYTASGGVETGLGRGPRGAAARLSLRAGLASLGDGPRSLLRAEASADARWFGLRATSFAVPALQAGEAWGAVRLGPRASSHVTAFVDARSAADPGAWSAFEARGAAGPGWAEGGAFAAEGASAGGELNLAFSPAVYGRAGASMDVGSDELLGLWAAAGYRHPCRCLAVGALATERMGRDGFDASLTLDLMP